jgi:hypothetical protein
MFEVAGADIQKLDDVQLRTLVARLAIAELSSKSFPISGVTAGGDQNAPDGGLDVRVEASGVAGHGDFVPRFPLGFQVKKPDMSAAAIDAEMKHGGILRPVIGELAELNGAYIIVSAQGSVADKPLKNRREAMATAVQGHASASKLHLDFYDRDRLATWVNQYPGVAAWVKARVGQPLAGWQPIGDWSGVRVGGDGRFICDDTACLLDTRSGTEKTLTVIDGINSLRDALANPGQCVRLIGMSGLGKTRLVQALFESDVGANALDPSLAIYADYSETPNPTAKQLALQLTETGRRAILIVDNCNPQTHSDLAKTCGSQGSKVSLITVEYDVRDDEPERTDVFRLQAASESTVAEWVKRNFEHVTQVDRDRIANFSGGNFRVAGVLAETVKRGDTLGDLRDRDLFRRIFQQRNDTSDELLQAAEALALVYSFDGEDVSDTGELASLAPMAGVTTNNLYAHVAELRRRSVIQSRGRWRALLPHAIANRLAAQALERIPATQLDSFCTSLPRRLQKSFARRLGYLHDNREAQAAIGRWLDTDGPFGDLLSASDDAAQTLRNLAPVAPAGVLRLIEQGIAGPSGTAILNPKTAHRWQLTMILKSLAFDPTLFERAAAALGKFVCAERPDENQNSARGAFEELFHLHLSGTQASPDQRRAMIESMFKSGDSERLRCGRLAIRALLQSGHFSSSSNFDFGARPRDFGWHPPTYGDIWNWYRDAIALAVKLSTVEGQRKELKTIVAGALRGLLGIKACLDALESAVSDFLSDGEWIEGWLAVRGAIRFDGEGWLPEVKERVAAIETSLRPADPLNEARAYILEGRGFSFDLMDGEEFAEKDYAAAGARLARKAEAIGKDFADQPDLLDSFLTEALQSEQAPRAYSFGIGLAQSERSHRELWKVLRAAFLKAPLERRNATILGGFLHQVGESDRQLSSTILDEVLHDSELLSCLVYLQTQAGIDEEAIGRLRSAIAAGRIDAGRFYSLANGVVQTAPQPPLALMLEELSRLEGGTGMALEILHMAIYCLKDDGIEIDAALFSIGHKLLLRTDYRNTSDVREYRIQQTIRDCYRGPEGAERSRELCQHLKQQIAEKKVYAFQLDHVFDALFEAQPLTCLDEFMLSNASGDDDDPIYGDTGLSRRSPLEKIDGELLWSWTDIEPIARYPLVSRSLGVFSTKELDEDDGLSPLFLAGLDRAPDKAAFLNSSNDRLRPSGWSGDLSVILDRRRTFLSPLTAHADPYVRDWTAKQIASLQTWADHERERESEREEAFE